MYDITISGFGKTRTYKEAECEMHDEFYVSSIDRFYKEISKIGIKPFKYDSFLELINCTHKKSKCRSNYVMIGDNC